MQLLALPVRLFDRRSSGVLLQVWIAQAGRRSGEEAVSFIPMVHFSDPSGALSTIWGWNDAAQKIEAVEPFIKRSVAQARRAGGTELRIEIYDDLADRVAFRARVK